MLVLGALLLVANRGVGQPVTSRTPGSQRAIATPTPAANRPLSVGRPIQLKATDLVKVQGGYYVEFPSAPPAVVIQYETDIPVTNMPAMTSQADQLIKVFQKDIEATGVSAAVLRATHFEGVGSARQGSGYGFVYTKSATGSWAREQKKGG